MKNLFKNKRVVILGILTFSSFLLRFISSIAFCLYGIEKEKWIFFLISGALVGLSYMTRVIGFVALPVIGLWLLIYSIWLRKSSDRASVINLNNIFAPVVIFLFGFVLITGLYLVKLHSFYGYWTIAGAYGSVKGMVSNEGAATTSGWENLNAAKAEESLYIKLIKKITINVQNYSTSLLGMLLFTVIFVIAGLFLRWKILYVVSFIAAYFAALLVQPLSPLLDERIRYLSPILPLFLIIASGGIVRIQDWIKWQVLKQAAIPVMVVIVLLSAIPQLMMFPIHFNNFWGSSNSVNFREEMGSWMEKNLPQPIRVMSRKPYIPYYADAVWFATPATYDEVIKLAKSHEVDYIVIDRDIEYFLRPELRFLFDPKEVPQELKLISGIRYPKTNELYIGLYKINRSITNNINKE